MDQLDPGVLIDFKVKHGRSRIVARCNLIENLHILYLLIIIDYEVVTYYAGTKLLPLSGV